MKKTIGALLALILSAWCNIAFGAEVAVEETAPIVEQGGAELETLAATDTNSVAMLFAPPAMAAGASYEVAQSNGIPLVVRSGTGQDTRLAVDTSQVDDSWPTWKKVAVIGGCVVVVGLTAWAIVEATQNGTHTSGDDSSQHVSVAVGGEGNSATVHYYSPTFSAATTTHNSGGEEGY